MRVWPNSECPACGAGRYEMCRTKDGRRCSQPHRTRPLGDLKGKTKLMKDQWETLEMNTGSAK